MVHLKSAKADFLQESAEKAPLFVPKWKVLQIIFRQFLNNLSVSATAVQHQPGSRWSPLEISRLISRSKTVVRVFIVAFFQTNMSFVCFLTSQF